MGLASAGDGTSSFRAVPPGSYTVKIELTGFCTREQKKTIVNASRRVDLGSVKLEGGSVTDVVSIVAEGVAIETKNSDHTRRTSRPLGDSFGSQIPNIGGASDRK